MAYPGYENGCVMPGGYEWGDRGRSSAVLLLLDAVHESPLHFASMLRCCESKPWLAVTTKGELMPPSTRQFITQHSRLHQEVHLPYKAFRNQGWWRKASPAHSGTRINLDLWAAGDPSFLDRVEDTILRIQTEPTLTIPWSVHGSGMDYWRGTEAGRLGVYDSNADILMCGGRQIADVWGSGYSMVRRGAMESEGGSQVAVSPGSHPSRVTLASMTQGLGLLPPTRPAVVVVEDERALVTLSHFLTGAGPLRPGRLRDLGLVYEVVRLLSIRSSWTRLHAIRRQRTEPLQSLLDRAAQGGAASSSVIAESSSPTPQLWGHGHRGPWTPSLSRMVRDHLAASRLPSSPNLTERWLLWEGFQRHLLGAWWMSDAPDYVKRTAMLSIAGVYPSPALLQRWGRLPPGSCSLCHGGESLCTQSHLQATCAGTKAARIAAHHALRSLLSTLLTSTSSGWESHPELTLAGVCSLLQSMGLHVPELPPFSHQASDASAPAQVNWSRTQAWRPDDTLLHVRRRLLVVMEFTRAWDSSPSYDDRQNEVKGRRYAAWVRHLRDHLAPNGWRVSQANFTIGSRGSILRSRWEELMDVFHIPPTARTRVYSLLHHQALSSLHDVFQAAKSARLRQSAQ
jgi:hypothetical protein